jgi:hypothetical protein
VVVVEGETFAIEVAAEVGKRWKLLTIPLVCISVYVEKS